MTGDEACVYYPQYCFHLSHTIDQWCPLRAADIHGLHADPAHLVQGIFFISNHPIAWVRIAGVVVAVDYFAGRFVYTIDDSSGKCIECTLEPAATRHTDSENQKRDGSLARKSPITVSSLSAPPQSEIDVGMVVIIKGKVKLFRDEKQLNIHKFQIVTSTDQEVQFWNKIRDFRRQFLDHPWMLSTKDLQKCRAEYLEKERSRSRKGGNAGQRGATAKDRPDNHSLARRDRKPAKIRQ